MSGPIASALQLHDGIIDRFRYHPTTSVTSPMHGATRGKFIGLADWILSTVPAGRHQDLALTALQESMMWVNAAIALDTEPGPS